jgi:hypothetical protein
MYSPRILTYNFPAFTVTVDAGQVLGSTAHPILGEVIKAVWNDSNTAATGSLYIQTMTPIIITIGSIMTTNTDKEVYLGTNPQAGKSSYGPVVADHLWISGKGLGLGSSGTLSLYYR